MKKLLALALLVVALTGCGSTKVITSDGDDILGIGFYNALVVDGNMTIELQMEFKEIRYDSTAFVITTNDEEIHLKMRDIRWWVIDR